MFKLASYALVALTAVSVVNGAAIFPRNTPPAGWVTEIMEVSVLFLLDHRSILKPSPAI